MRIASYMERKEASRGATYVLNAIQVGGYDPCTITDFEVPKRYGLRQTIGNTLGIGGIFRALRTIPVMLDFARDMQAVCPDALFINFTNPLSVITLSILRQGVRAVGLCHSVQDAIPELFALVEIDPTGVTWSAAGINHMGWLLSLAKGREDLYPMIKQRAFSLDTPLSRKEGVRIEILRRFGYFVTESSHHNAEYSPYFIKQAHPELIDRYDIPLDLYLRRCVRQIERWKTMRAELLYEDRPVDHTLTEDYVSRIFNAIETGRPVSIYGSVANVHLITNLPLEACVEVPCLVDRAGIHPCYVGDLPPQLAALNRTQINPQLLALEAALTGKREHIYQAALLDPHTAADLTVDKIVAMCDDLMTGVDEFADDSATTPAC